jgi:arginine-glutamic acid dipeptide repeat-containing protein
MEVLSAKINGAIENGTNSTTNTDEQANGSTPKETSPVPTCSDSTHPLNSTINNKPNESETTTSTSNSVNNDSGVSYARTLNYRSTYRPYGRPRKTGYTFKEENIKLYTDTNGVAYRVGDHVYMDINKPNQPFAIACVLDFKMTKRDTYMIEVRRYYRPNELPDGVYMPLMQDRLVENKNAANELIVLEPIIKGRELFASDCKDIYPSSYIKGRCRVFHYQDILDAKHFKPFADTFFSILTYNPDARRLANTQGEIRVGASHQALMPECNPVKEIDLKPCDYSETVIWLPNRIDDVDLLTYLQAARSMAAFAGMCDKGSTDDMYDAAQSDVTTLNAMNALNQSDYDTAKALQLLMNNPAPKLIDKQWNEEDQVSNLLIRF